MDLITLLRAAITSGGGTPASYNRVQLLQQLVTVYGGTPTKFTMTGLLREAIIARGGTPTQQTITSLLRELIVTLGATPTTYTEQALLVQLAGLTIGGATPVNTVAPAVTGTPGVDSVLTVSNGTWTGAPAIFSRQWYSNTTNSEVGATLLPGETGDTFNQTSAVAGLYLFARVQAAGAAAAVSSNIVGPVAAASGLSSTNATRTTANGAAPEVDLTMGSDIFDGYILRIQRTATGTDFTSPTLDVSHYVTPDERSAGTITKAALLADGYTDPSGYYAQRYRWEREDGVVGPWSTITDTVVASVATLTSTSGQDKFGNLVVSNGNLRVTQAGDGVIELVRATVAGANQSQFEVTLSTLSADGDEIIYFGLDDGTTAFSTFNVLPGLNNSAGIGFEMNSGGAINAYRNSGSQIVGSGGVRAGGDTYTIRRDVAGSEVRVYRRRSGTETLIITVPWSSTTFSRAFVGMRKASVLDVNFGASAFQHPLDSGYSYYG